VIRPLDVIWIFDASIHPKKWKMAVCIQSDCGFFFRINSSDRWPLALRIEKEPHHLFLKHDSFIECGNPLELDDYVVQAAIDKSGILGTVHPSLASAIYKNVELNETLSVSDKAAVAKALKCAR